jgi:hypothetical protein
VRPPRAWRARAGLHAVTLAAWLGASRDRLAGRAGSAEREVRARLGVAATQARQALDGLGRWAAPGLRTARGLAGAGGARVRRVVGRRAVVAGGIGAVALLAAVVLRAPGPPATGRAATPVAVSSALLVDAAAADVARVPVALADRPPARLPADGVPPGWELKEFAGRAEVELVRDEGRLAVRLRSERASFAIYRDAVVDLDQHPRLRWSWKVTRLPAQGDVRDRGRDDQAAQLYVVFPRWPSPRTASDVIGYVWDSRAPAGTRLTSARADNVRIIVVESGRARLDRWVSYERDVAEDHRALFGRPPPRVGKVALMTDANDTRSETEALFADLNFGPAKP